ITNGAEAKTAIVFAMTDKEKRHKGISAFIVDADTEGYRIGKLEDKLGIRGSSTAQIHLENCRIPASQLLASEGDGFKVAMATLDGGRISIAGQALGIARAAFERAVDYSKERVQFGKPIAKLQAIQFMIADMATKIDAARLLTMRAAMKKAKGERHSKDSAMAKIAASEAAMWVASKAIQIHGGYGYCNEYQVERNYRDAKITEIYEGTSEVQRLVVASQVLGKF
ncbi:acyl-CoA dehydrogenase family protein, partial [Bdellovibrionota bacterium]